MVLKWILIISLCLSFVRSVDLLTEICPSISFAWEPPESSVMRRPPRQVKTDRLVRPSLLFYSYLQVCSTTLFVIIAIPAELKLPRLACFLVLCVSGRPDRGCCLHCGLPGGLLVQRCACDVPAQLRRQRSTQHHRHHRQHGSHVHP